MTRHARLIVSDSKDESFCYAAHKVNHSLWHIFHGLRVVGTATRVHGGWSCSLTPGSYLALAADIEHAVEIIHEHRTPTTTAKETA